MNKDFEYLKEHYEQMIWKIIWKYFSYLDENEKQDYFQEGLLILWKSFQDWDISKSTFSTYLYTRLRNDLLKYRYKSTLIHIAWMKDFKYETAPIEDFEIENTKHNTSKIIEDKEQMEHLLSNFSIMEKWLIKKLMDGYTPYEIERNKKWSYWNRKRIKRYIDKIRKKALELSSAQQLDF